MSLEKEDKKDKPGESYEELVEVLSRYLHEKAIVTHNDKIEDVDTGQKRQIDISIKLKDGPTEFLAIIEARDRSRKVDVGYVEQVISKRDSVKADKAIIVSNKGFTKPAMQKAEKYGIETYSLAEALKKEDWSISFRYFEAFTLWTYEGYSEICFIDKNMRIINLHESQINMLSEDSGALVLYDEGGHPKHDLSILMRSVYNSTDIQNLTSSDINKAHSYKAYVSVPKEAGIYIIDENGTLQLLEQYCVVGRIKRVFKEYKPTAKQYKDEKTGKLLAEVIDTDDPSFTFEVLHNIESGNVSIRKKR